ncbi:unnamed protein product [Orchesella dallaii]|uniref:Uncharacterized protein n=1 Tax=Orchesella dallaii TaxID=48710 RepID=A0ABP1QM90_9HEXA
MLKDMKVAEIVEIDGVPGSSGTVPKPTHSWKCPTVDKELGNVSFEWNQPVTEGTRFNSIYKINRWEGGGNKAQKEMEIRKEDQVWNFSLHRAVQQKRADHHLSCARDNQSQYSYIFPK